MGDESDAVRAKRFVKNRHFNGVLKAIDKNIESLSFICTITPTFMGNISGVLKKLIRDTANKRDRIVKEVITNNNLQTKNRLALILILYATALGKQIDHVVITSLQVLRGDFCNKLFTLTCICCLKACFSFLVLKF